MATLIKKYHDRENGFTLIELLIVVLIIGILAAIAIPVYLGIQQQGQKAAIRSDVNIEVKRVQVGLTEGDTVANVKANQASYLQTSVKGEKGYIAASTTAGAGANDFSISNALNTTTTPAGAFNYSYTYDSVTGNFTDSNTGLAFGSAAPSLTITTGSLADGVTGSAYSATVTAATVNPSGTTVWSATGLPTNWSINASTGVISAAASDVNTATTYPVTVTATNGAATDSHLYNIKVASKPVIVTTTVPNGVVGTSYSQTLTATGSPTITFAVTSGSLPAGLNLTSDGTLSGTPTTASTASFTVTASNGAGNSVGQSYTLTVNSKPAITTTTLTGAVQGSNGYSATIASTGSPSATYTATGLPAGMSINNSTGVISGTPTSAATYTPTVTATNTAGSDSKTYNMVISPNILTNGSFETTTSSLSPWTVSGVTGGGNYISSDGSVITSTGYVGGTLTAQSGSNYLLFYSGDAGTGAPYLLQDVTTTVTAGKTYSGGMWLSGVSANNETGTIYLVSFVGSTGTVINSAPYTTGAGWTYVGISGVAPNAGTTLRLQFVPNTGQGNIAFDNANLGVIQ